jgi:hypothetical protein
VPRSATENLGLSILNLSGIIELFANFLVLRLYLPGINFIFFAHLFNPTQIGSSYGTATWVLLPIVLGQAFHLPNACFSLAFGFEYCVARPSKEGKGQWWQFYKNIQARVDDEQFYIPDTKEYIKRTIHLAQLYVNLSISFLTVYFVSWNLSGWRWSIVIMNVIAIFALLSGVLNHCYVKAVLSSPKFRSSILIDTK